MAIYCVGFFLTVFFSLFSYDKSKPNDKKSLGQMVFTILSFLPLFTIASFRYGVGNDYFSYANYFVNSLNHHFMEVGFDWLMQFIRGYTANYVWMFAICSFIFLYFIYKAIYNQSPNPTLSIFLFICAPYYFEFFSGMRQMMAVAIFLYSIKYIKSRKLLPYLLLNIVGTLLHSSGLIFLPVYFLYNVKLKPKMCIFLGFLTIFSRPLIKKILVNIIMVTKYSNYFDTKFNTGHFGIVTLLVPLFIFIFAILYYNRHSDDVDQKDYQFYCNLMFIQVLIVLVQDLSPLITRIGWGFGISQIILIPMALNKINNKKNKLYFTVIICSLFVTYLCMMRFSGEGTLLPFRWFFDYL